MTLELIGHDRRGPVEQALLNYFGRLDGGRAVSALHAGARWLTCVTTISLGGKTARGVARAPAGGDTLDRALRQSFYRAALPFLDETPPWGSLTGIRPAKLALKLSDAGRDPLAALTGQYHVSPARAALAVQCARASDEARRSLDAREFSLYVGIPFCPSRCAYCSFVSNSVEKSGSLIEPYVAALEAELARLGELTKRHGRRISAVYVGGGTPTTLSAGQLDRLLTAISGCFDMSAVREFTVEAGRPDTVTAEKLGVLRACGVDRVSVNPQTMHDGVLAAIGRRHTADQTLQAFALAREAGFPCLNADVIAGLPGDDPAGFSYSLDRILAETPEHVTVHTLSVKKGARLEAEASPYGRGVGDMLAFADAALRSAGYEPYYLYRQKYMAGGFENVGWRKNGAYGLYNLCMMEELHTVLSAGAGGVSKLVHAGNGLIERVCHPKFPLEYLTNCDKLSSNLRMLDDFLAKESPHVH